MPQPIEFRQYPSRASMLGQDIGRVNDFNIFTVIGPVSHGNNLVFRVEK